MNENGRDTQRRLLAAAERLFAERGIDAVSTRQITQAAGTNPAAIHYHFGSRAGLVRELVERRAESLGAARDQLLDEMEADGPLTLASVVEALIRPTADLVRRPDGRHHAGFIVAITTKRDLMPLVREAFDRHTDRYLSALAPVTPHLDDATRRLRYGIARDIVNRVVGQPDGALQRWIASTDAELSGTLDDTTVAAVTDVVTAIFSAEVRTRPTERRVTR